MRVTVFNRIHHPKGCVEIPDQHCRYHHPGEAEPVLLQWVGKPHRTVKKYKNGYHPTKAKVYSMVVYVTELMPYGPAISIGWKELKRLERSGLLIPEIGVKLYEQHRHGWTRTKP